MIIKKGQTVKALKDCRANDLLFEVITGPKQGDTVWCKDIGTEWFHVVFVAEHTYHNAKKYIVVYDGDVVWFDEITTTDPYALKYELTAQEALVAIGQGKVLTDKDNGYKFKWIDNVGVSTFVNGEWIPVAFPNIGVMYAIVEE